MGLRRTSPGDTESQNYPYTTMESRNTTAYYLSSGSTLSIKMVEKWGYHSTTELSRCSTGYQGKEIGLTEYPTREANRPAYLYPIMTPIEHRTLSKRSTHRTTTPIKGIRIPYLYSMGTLNEVVVNVALILFLFAHSQNNFISLIKLLL